jgi:hypothetical protein
MTPARRPQAIPLYSLRPGPTRLRLTRVTWPPLFDTFGYLMSIGSIWWLGATVARFVEGR